MLPVSFTWNNEVHCARSGDLVKEKYKIIHNHHITIEKQITASKGSNTEPGIVMGRL